MRLPNGRSATVNMQMKMIVAMNKRMIAMMMMACVNVHTDACFTVSFVHYDGCYVE